MVWLQRRAWWLLLTMTVLVALIGLWPLILGIKEDASVPLGITGMTASQLEAASAEGYRLLDFKVRSGGMALIVIGTLLSAVLLGAYRQNRPWAWWVMWVLPAWGALGLDTHSRNRRGAGSGSAVADDLGNHFRHVLSGAACRQRAPVRRAPIQGERVGLTTSPTVSVKPI